MLWKTAMPAPELAASLTREVGLSPLCAAVLAGRGLSCAEAAALLRSDAPLLDPCAFTGMSAATARIEAALESGELVVVFGDYDCDGVVATVILCDYLSELGANVRYLLPSRAGAGYGLSIKDVELLARLGAKLIITVDNGISAALEAEKAAELGIDLIVTDHHRPPERLPQAVALIDPYLPGEPEALRPLCGAGLAFKLVCALQGEEDSEALLERYGELLALATLADVVPLTGENRRYVETGVALLAENALCPGMKELLKAANIGEKPMTARWVARNLAPRINAAGRMADARIAARLLLCEEEEEAVRLCGELETLNNARRHAETALWGEVAALLVEKPELSAQRLIVLAGEGWPVSVIGIVCSRVVERYGKPCILISLESGAGARGSGRSVEGFSLVEAVARQAKWLSRYGGHDQAVGFSLEAAAVEPFIAALQEDTAKRFPIMPAPCLTVDAVVPLSALSLEGVRSLERLEPCGAGNPEPVLALEAVTLAQILPTENRQHCRLRLTQNGQSMIAIWFGMRPDVLPFAQGDKVDAALSPSVDVYNGSERVNLRIEDMRLSGIDHESVYREEQRYLAFCRGEAGEYKPPSREQVAVLYKYLRRAGALPYNRAFLCNRMALEGVDTFSALAALDALLETKLVILKERGELVYLHVDPAPKRVELASAPTLRRMKE